MSTTARINTIVPTKTKARIAVLVRKTGVKPADVVRIGRHVALDQFEQQSIRLPLGGKRKGGVCICRFAFDPNEAWCHIGTMSVARAQNVRVVARVPNQIRDAIQMAADLAGAPLNQFLVQTAYKEAKQILERESLVRLSESQAKQVFALLDKPPKPNANLKRSARLFKANVRV